MFLKQHFRLALSSYTVFSWNEIYLPLRVDRKSRTATRQNIFTVAISEKNYLCGSLFFNTKPVTRSCNKLMNFLIFFCSKCFSLLFASFESLKRIWQIFFYLLDGIYMRTWCGNRKKKRWILSYFHHLKMWNFTSCWVRNRWGFGPGTSQAVTSKQECRSTYF